MTRLRAVLWRLRNAFAAQRRDRDLHDEIDAHLDEATEDYIRRGFSPADARRAARLDFGGVVRIEEAYREHLAFRWIDAARRDLRHALRALRRRPGFSIVVVLVLALGTSASTAVFTLLNRIVLQPLPFPSSDRLVNLGHAIPGRNVSHAGISDGLFFFYRDHARSLEAIGLYKAPVMQNLQTDSGAVRIEMSTAEPGFFRTLGVRPALGRLFTDDDARPGFADSRWAIPILLTYDFWAGRFGADPAIVGRTLVINDLPRLVVGVLPEGFAFPDAHTQVWILSAPAAAHASFARAFGWKAVARLRPGVAASEAQADLAAQLPHVAGAYRDATPEQMRTLRVTPIVTPLKNTVIGDAARVLWPLFGGMTCLLLIAATNAGGLFLVRVEQRRREVAIRRALGAEWPRIASQFLIEALALTLTAAAVGIVMARPLLQTVLARAPVDLPRAGEVRLDSTAVLFALTAAFAIAGAYSMMSLRQLTGRTNGGLLRTGHSANTSRAGRAIEPLIVAQTAIALALLVGSALMVRTYQNLSRTPLGFEPHDVLTVEISLPFREADRHTQVYDDVVERVRHLPGLVNASAASFAPLTPGPDLYPINPGGEPIRFKFFVPGYFQTIKTPVIEGDTFAPGTRPTQPYPVLVTASLARRLFTGGRAIGQSIRRLNQDGSPVTRGGVVPDFTIAGVVGDVREAALRDDPSEVVYIPLIEPRVEQSIVPTDMTLFVRTDGDPLSHASSIRAVITAIDPALGIGQVRTMDAIVAEARGSETFVGALLLLAAVISLLLGVIGIYGAVTQVVRSRTREIGIRIALGANRGEVLRMVTARSLWACIIGAVLGLGLSIGGANLLNTMLFGVAPRDPTVLGFATVILLGASVLASCTAGGRAIRIAPVVALKDE